MRPSPLGLFEAVGIELEYMIVDSETLAVRPIADELLKTVAGRYDTEVALGAISWSNELALHVVEAKTTDPARSLQGVDALFQEHVDRMEGILAPLGARLLPTGMHPWMDPHRELRLWPHGYDEIYATFHRIFDCRGHGWANLQSVHVNLPFRDDDEFGRLHAAIRLVLPILPGIAASSPMTEGRLTGLLDTRVEMYRHNADRVPSVAGQIVPEQAFTRGAYQADVLQRIYDDLQPFDPEGVLRHEWVNARGCIARFDRMAIEIRLLDVQECPRADIAIAAAVTAAVRLLVEERTIDSAEQRGWTVPPLATILADAVRNGDESLIRNAQYLSAFGFPGATPCRVRELWQHLIETAGRDARTDALAWQEWYTLFAEQGSLARRIRRALGPAPTPPVAHDVYRQLADCLQTGRLFRADAV